MKALRGTAISVDEVELVITALKKYADDLKQYRSWLQTRGGKTLPGAEVAAEEVFKEMDGYYMLGLRIMRDCCTAGVPMSAEPLPYWEPCNPGCDPEFNGQRDRGCAKICENARVALGVGGTSK